MARPSQQLDQALLHSGRQLYPQLGCAGLTQRAVAEHAGVAPGLFHYHFGSKDGFLRALLQQLYEALFAGLQAGASADGPPLQRLRRVLLGLAGFAREQRPLLLRLAADASAGHAVVQDFLRANAPRHLGLVLGLLAEARAGGALPPAADATAAATPPLAEASFLLGAVLAPMLAAPAMAALQPALPGAPPQGLAGWLDAAVLSDAAVAARCDRALAALALRLPPPGAPGDAPAAGPTPVAHAPGPATAGGPPAGPAPAAAPAAAAPTATARRRPAARKRP